MCAWRNLSLVLPRVELHILILQSEPNERLGAFADHHSRMIAMTFRYPVCTELEETDASPRLPPAITAAFVPPPSLP